MINVSRKYLETMQNRRDFYATAEITFADGREKTIEKKDLFIDGNSVVASPESSSFPLGVFVARMIALSLVNDDDRWSDYDFYGAKISLKTKFDLDDGTTETINVGTFTVITPESYGTTVGITAMDDSYKTDKDYSTSLMYPLTAGEALRDSCRTCGISLITSTFANDDYIIRSKPEKLTHRQFIGMIAMVAGGNAIMDEYNRLAIKSYDFSLFEQSGLDGGVFDSNTPYATGDNADGGTFLPWNTVEDIDGGEFGDRSGVHVLYDFKSGMTVGVDDVVITGVQIKGENDEVYLYGQTGYVLSLENPLAIGDEENLAEIIGKRIVGLHFRPFSGDHIAYPLAEFMDLAYIADFRNNIYQTVITDISFNYFGYTTLKCSADSPIRNSSTYYGNETKAIVEARKLVKQEKTDRELAIEDLAKQLANNNGLYMTTEKQDDGSTIYYMHNKPTLAESIIVWKLTVEALGISTDGGKTYPYGLDVSGAAILDRIYTIGLNADYIKTGSITADRIHGGTLKFSGDIASDYYGRITIERSNSNYCFSVDASGMAIFDLRNENIISRVSLDQKSIGIRAPEEINISSEKININCGAEGNDRIYYDYGGVIFDGNNGVDYQSFFVEGNISLENFLFLDESLIYAVAKFSVVNGNLAIETYNNRSFSIGQENNQIFKISDKIECFANIDMHNNNIVSQSDERLKTAILPSTVDALETINGIQMYEFDWVETSEHEDVKFVAQQLETVNPDFVHVDKNTGCYSVKPLEMIPYLVKAVQELSEQVESLQAEIAELKGQPIERTSRKTRTEWKPTPYTMEEKRDFVKKMLKGGR